MAILLCGPGAGCGTPADPTLPVYSTEQTDSAHAGYRRTTLSTSDAVYVNDYEEQALMLSGGDPKEAIGRSSFGPASVFAIPGQERTAYVAADVGSEMPAYEVYRHERQPPFDWRRATFRTMRLDMPDGPAANKETSDPAVIAEVVKTLRDGTPAATQPKAPPLYVPGTSGVVHHILMFSDEIPGLVFHPWLYIVGPDEVYLADNASITFSKTEQTVHAAWIAASLRLAAWMKTP
jgi:hypothetical protein